MKGVRKLPLDELFAACEVVVLAGGHTAETHHLICKEHFARMQPGALFVNIARGRMVCEQDMVEALAERDLYLALDVFEQEPLPADSPLRRSDRVLLVPHRGNTASAFEQRRRCLADEIERFHTGRRPDSALTLDRLGAMSASRARVSTIHNRSRDISRESSSDIAWRPCRRSRHAQPSLFRPAARRSSIVLDVGVIDSPPSAVQRSSRGI